MQPTPITIGMFLFPDLTLLDLTGPYEVFCRMPGAQVHLIARSLQPVRSQHGMSILPNTTFANAPPLDVLFVPGGPGVDTLLEDEEFLNFLRTQGQGAKFVTSVCTGALLLGAAGLLQGYRAATHWLSRDLLQRLGAEPVADRVVIDRNRITGGGVTAGIDFGLVVAAALCGQESAEEIQLFIEYNPAPPFNCGAPELADAALVERVTRQHHARQEARLQIVERVAQKGARC